jgi:glycerophosphoryl diester phosphodiesterase
MSFIKPLLAIALSLTAVTCAAQHNFVPKSFPKFMKQGHRGTRGLAPENTIFAMLEGIRNGAQFIEVDVYTSKDGKVFISHDPSPNILHTLTADGKELTKAEAAKYVFHQMNYEDIAKFDVGSKYFPAYPKQKLVKANIPLLSDLIDSVELYIKKNRLKPVVYNIELKNTPDYDNVKNGTPAELVDATMAVVKSKKLAKDRYYLQSFDFRPLKYIHEKYPEVTIGFLTNSKLTFEENLKELGFNPAVYSPYFALTTAEMAKKAHDLNMKLVPWTVNTIEEMKKQIDMGVDGIITDYPNFFAEIGK